jgi:hypothetical protein
MRNDVSKLVKSLDSQLQDPTKAYHPPLPSSPTISLACEPVVNG